MVLAQREPHDTRRSKPAGSNEDFMDSDTPGSRRKQSDLDLPT